MDEEPLRHVHEGLIGEEPTLQRRGVGTERSMEPKMWLNLLSSLSDWRSALKVRSPSLTNDGLLCLTSVV